MENPTEKHEEYDDEKNIGVRRDSKFVDGQYVGAKQHDTDSVGGTTLKRALKGRHMQMIAIGGAIGAGLFVGSGNALSTGGPGSLVICFMIIGLMLLFVVQALAELAVVYPVNGAFYQYVCRFIDPSWGFAIGWDYAIGWLTILPFEITAACITLTYWQHAQSINIGVWIATFLVALIIIQFFGVRGYGEVEFVLAMVKIAGCLGFIILGIIINCGGVPTSHQGYLGATYWHTPWSQNGFNNGFKGFCSVFVTASFAYGGTELSGLAAAEASNPAKQVPRAAKQVFWRITFFYVVNLFILGLIIPSNDPHLLAATGANTKASPFVLAIQNANIAVLPSIFNAIITISVLSVANSATFGSTRTIQALAMQGMAPKFLAYVDKAGRPIPTVILQILFGLLAFIGESKDEVTVFNWLLALSGLANFFIWGSICLAHIRFRRAWAYNGHSVDELRYKAAFGVIGSWIGLFLNFICLVANFYVSLFPIQANPKAEVFFQGYLAGPLILFLYLCWKIGSWVWYPEHRPFYVKIQDVDLYTGMRDDQLAISSPTMTGEERKASIVDYQQSLPHGGAAQSAPMRIVRALI